MILIDYDKCDFCKLCVQSCPTGVFEVFEDEVVVANPHNCLLCCSYVEICPKNAIIVENC